MKTFFTLALILTTAVFAQAQKKPSLGNSMSSQNPVSDFYSAKLYIESHTNNGVKVSHGLGDFAVFSSEGEYNQVFQGSSNSGTWKYNFQTKKLTITMNGNSNEYEATQTDDKHLQLVKGGEIILFRKN